MDEIYTITLASWGALIGTISLIWNIIASTRNAPRIRISNKSNVTYMDSKVVSIDAIENGTRKKLAQYEHIEIVNIGKMPTTIISLSLEHELSNGSEPIGKVSIMPVGFTWHFGSTLPILLGPGEMCSCRIANGNVNAIKNRGNAVLFVDVSHKVKPIEYRLNN